MNQSEKPKFEQAWQRAFEPAAETPPPAAWDAIEKRLNAQEATVVPLSWWNNPKVWYAAAAVAALLLLSWPVLESYEKDSGETTTQLAAEKSSSPIPSGEAKSPGVAAPGVATPGPESKADERIVTVENTEEIPPAALPLTVTESPERVAIATHDPAVGESLPPALADSPSLAEVPKDAKVSGIETKFGQSKTLLNATPTPDALTPRTPTIIVITQTTRKIPADSAGDLERVIMGSSTVPLRTKTLTQSIAALSPMADLAKLDVRFQKPLVSNDLAILETTATARPRRSRVREFWAGLGLMPAAFNPKMNVTSAPQAFANANASRQSLSNANQARLSYAVQAQAGKQLSKHWSVETGVSYLQGNSTFESGGYVLDAVTSQSANVLEDALFSNAAYNNYAAAPGLTTTFDKSTGSYIDFEQRTSNDYRYVQLPVQAGYTLNPDGKLNYTVLGGVVANLFLQNEIKNKAGYISANTADDGLYRALNWSAATGVRVNYRLSDHWNASLTGSYQKAIASILKGDGVLESRPQLYGMAWGVRYVF